MESKFSFTLLTPKEFADWINVQSTSRRIREVQEHHTYRPNYGHFKGDNHFQLQQNMKRFHVHDRGWSDIGQHFTIFPDGLICTGRPLHRDPACIGGHNIGGICIENLGNFNTGGDTMSADQKASIIQVTALLLNRYALPCNEFTVVYHHWFTPSGKRTDNGSSTQKTCPGTNFFGGNKVDDANENFIPLVNTALQQIKEGKGNQGKPSKAKYFGVVTASALNVREKPTTNSSKINKLLFDEEVRILKEENGWYQIEPTGWVSARFIKTFTRAQVTASALNVRLRPSTKAEKLFKLMQGEIVRIYEQNEDWSKIAITGGWVATRYLKKFKN